ncbi:MAG TPA: asparaginase [Sphingobium sp.]|jgi:L-asparaginase|uniref:asparaginase domain-containing protein n=1 Tax=unclassified Sphingobium TaxID=2611147 RepID=UPI0007F41A25|nr:MULTISPECIES: asparaginase domain-containing protein [unclassified Sphingobium]OAN57788.1 asparaginase [Sphingobium sp. TCM1]WIW87553.1 asparaginase domain-containing protein [Sphingobium sp. V4]HAF41941.1 asparaginase [Sphingobium sp.]
MLSPETPILLLTTGGTIDKIYFDALSDYQVGETVMAKLLEVARVKRPFRIEEVTRKDSLELDDQDRALIYARVAAASERHIVITHGTDTMTETAKQLKDIAGKTIVLVGALAPARFGESDASFNLGMAFATAQVAEPGVYITMSGSVFRADQVVKDRAKGAFVPVQD